MDSDKILEVLEEESAVVRMLEHNTEQMQTIKKREEELRLERASLCFLLSEEYSWLMYDIADVCGIHESTVGREIRDYKKQVSKNAPRIIEAAPTKTYDDMLAAYKKDMEEADSILPTD